MEGWNGRFRTTFEVFLRGERRVGREDCGSTAGHPEVYGHKQREAEASINFVSCTTGSR